MLTPGQIAHFETFGFVVLSQHFTPEEVAIMKQESDELFDEVRGGTRFTGEKWEPVQPFFERRPFMSRVPEDDRIYNIGVDLLGPDFILEVTEGNLHVGDTPWHGDPPDEASIRHPKITFYTEPVTRETGCLRVIPGSHRNGPPDAYDTLRNANYDPDFRPFGLAPSEVPSYASNHNLATSWCLTSIRFTPHLAASLVGNSTLSRSWPTRGPTPRSPTSAIFTTVSHTPFTLLSRTSTATGHA